MSIKLLMMIITLFLANMTFAQSLEEQVDKLTPQEAQRIMAKLQAKVIEPIPHSIFTNLGLSVSVGAIFSDKSSIYDDIDNAFERGEDFDTLGVYRFSALWGRKWKLGFGMGYIGKYDTEEVSSDIFEDVSINSLYFQLEAAYKAKIAENLFLMPQLGVGITQTTVVFERTDDNSFSTYRSRYTSGNITATASLSLMYFLNPVLSFGLEAGYQHLKADEFKRSGIKDVATNVEMELGGAFVGFKLGYNL